MSLHTLRTPRYARLAIALLPIVLLVACSTPPPAASAPSEPAPSLMPTASPAAAMGPATSMAPASPAASASAPVPADATAPPSNVGMAETARESVRSTTIWLARGVDSWFGDKPFSDGGKVTNGQLDLGLLKRQGDRLEADLRLNARFALPNIDHLGYVYVGRDNEREVITDKPGALSRQDQLQNTRAQDTAFFVGLGRTLNEAFDMRIGLRGAFKPYAQARLSLHWQLGADDGIDLRQTLFWTVDDRAGSTTAVSFDHIVGPRLGVRWLSAATVTQAQPQFAWASSLGAYQWFGGQRRLSFEALVNGQQGSGVAAQDYGLQARWEQPVHDNWLLGGVVVGHFWPRPDAQSVRRGAWALGVSLKMRF